MNRKLVATVLVWLEAIVLIGVGIGLLVARTVSIQEPVEGSTDTLTVTAVPAAGIGVVLLSVGLLILAALLIIEANRPSHPTELAERPSADADRP
ncbi:hypothetical protein SRABI76_02412 [Microbacterium oxydans]|uniref:hypothetical protein n=1 Tax=Microbacterium oxydans TaxID=82380 RepID=UPI001D3FA2BC|nr:hypothetical protein [Microbacterium oxydans]CAH0217037.1 hypothetical protein SRABI76_02412 [Microbacterium oxydans]